MKGGAECGGGGASTEQTNQYCSGGGVVTGPCVLLHLFAARGLKNE